MLKSLCPFCIYIPSLIDSPSVVVVVTAALDILLPLAEDITASSLRPGDVVVSVFSKTNPEYGLYTGIESNAFLDFSTIPICAEVSQSSNNFLREFSINPVFVLSLSNRKIKSCCAVSISGL